jgi:CHAD domain-containing protein
MNRHVQRNSAVNSDGEFARRLEKHARKQVRKLRKTYKAAVRGSDTQAVHDLRVATRRLQTVLALAALDGPRKKADKPRKQLKKLRHALSLRRDIDVLAAAMRSRAGNSASARRRVLWNLAAREIANQGREVVKQSARWLKRHKLGRIESRIKTIMARRLKRGLTLDDQMRAIHGAHRKWKQTIREAALASDSSRFHEVRIKTKTFRYMMELVSHIVGSDRSADLIEWLKGIQDELGEWRDQTELCHRLADILSRDASLQADAVATAMIDSARRRTAVDDQHARYLIASLRKADSRKQIVALTSVAPSN